MGLGSTRRDVSEQGFFRFGKRGSGQRAKMVYRGGRQDGEKMMKQRAVLLFPGQGSQTVGMGQDLAERFELAKSRFRAADEQLGFPLSQTLFNGPDAELTRTALCQPALFLHGYVCFELLRQRLPELEIAAAAGLSLGEFTAHAASGAFSFETGLDLVSKRGRFMEEASQETEGLMAAMIGGNEEDILALAAEFEVDVANYNAPGQWVISGPAARIREAAAQAESRGVCAAKIINVSGAFHSRLMSSARRKLEAELEKVTFSQPAFPVYSNVDAAPAMDRETIRDTLRRQVTGSVRWRETMRALLDAGERRFIELGPGRTLAGFIKRIDRKAEVHCVSDSRSLIEAVTALS